MSTRPQLDDSTSGFCRKGNGLALAVQVEIRKPGGADGEPGAILGTVSVTLTAVRLTAAALEEGAPPKPRRGGRCSTAALGTLRQRECVMYNMLIYMQSIRIYGIM